MARAPASLAAASLSEARPVPLADVANSTALAPDAAASPAEPWRRYGAARRWSMLLVLLLAATCSYLDRHVISVLLEPIKRDFQVSDTQLGLLTGFAFAIFYAVLGIPVARWADRGNRRLVVTLSLAVWSVFTALSGLTTSFTQLALARIGVGAGEAGAIPPGQSLLADYFPPRRRGMIIALFTASATIGYLVAYIGGAVLAQRHGWRDALIILGLPGLALALVAHFALDEPRLRQRAANAKAHAAADDGLAHALRALVAKRSFLWVLDGISCYGIVAYGAAIFMPSFMIRSLKVSMAQVGVGFGLMSAAVSLAALLAGGALADRLARRDIRWYAWLPALACGLGCPFQVGALLVHDYGTFLWLSAAGGILVGLGLASTYTVVHAVCGSAHRTLALALFGFTISLVGSGFGPLMTGALSDGLAARFGAESLRYAMVIATAFLAPSAWCLWRCGLAMPRDLEA